MNTIRLLRSLALKGVLGAALSAATSFAISNEELATLRAKAESGNGIAQYNLGLLYASIGEPIADPIEAYVWLNLAADNGSTGKALLVLQSQLTPEQVSEAKRRLEKRRAEIGAKKSTDASPISAPSNPIAAPAAVADSAASDAEAKKLSNELAASWKENEELKARLAGVNDEVSKLRAASANFEGERNALLQKISNAEKSGRDSLSTELSAANAKLKSAEAELSGAAAAVAELATAKQSLASASEQNQKLTSENQKLSTQLAEASKAVEAQNSAQKDLEAARAEVARLQSQLSQAANQTAATADVQKQLEETQVKLEAALRSYDLQQKEVEKLNKALANIDGEREGLAKQLAATKAAKDNSGEVTRLTAELKDARDRLTAAEQALARTKADRERAGQEASQAAQQQISQLQAELQGIRSQNSELQAQLTKATEDRESLKQQLAAKPAPEPAPVNPEFQTRAQRAEEALASANLEKASLSEQVAKLQADLSQAVAAAASAAPAPAAAVTAPAPESATSTEDAAALRKQLDETQMKLDASLRTFQLKQEEIDRLQNALANIDNERAQLADRLNEANTRANQSASQATAGQEASAQLTGIREQLRQAQNQIASLATENQQLKNRLALSGPPPSSLMGVPTRPGSAAAQAITSTRPAEPAATPAARTHTVVDGDTLTRIARRYYGSSDRWAEILEANRGAIKDPNNLTLGTKLRIP